MALISGLVLLLSLIQSSQAVQHVNDKPTPATVVPQNITQSTVISNDKLHQSTERVRFSTVQDRSLAQMGLLSRTDILTSLKDVQQSYALDFLQTHGADFGVQDPSQELSLISLETDQLGETHLRYQQQYKQVPVFGAQLSVHYDAQNRIKVINGLFVPNIALNPTPQLDSSAAAEFALYDVTQNPPDMLLATPVNYDVKSIELAVYRTNLARGEPGRNYLAYVVEVTALPLVREQVIVDAQKGTIIERINLLDSVLNREIYNQQYQASSRIWSEGDALPYTGVGSVDVNNQIAFSEDMYNFMWTLSGGSFYSWDGADAPMHSIYNADPGFSICDTAWWDGAKTSYCPGVTSDDVVAHEWGHAYTDGTHNLFRMWQPGALNESYADIWGETVDLINSAGLDDVAGTVREDNTCAVNDLPTRWLIGEDSPGLGGALRDMWLPSCFRDPNKVSDSSYWCTDGGSRSIHTNSGIPNHAYALLVDGGTFNGQTITGIGLTKAAHIYWRAQKVYQTPTSNFVNHGDALTQSCQDLIGATLTVLSTEETPISGNSPAVSNEQINSSDCDQLSKAIEAVELMQAPSCNFAPNLAQNPPALCSTTDTYTSLLATDWESGKGAWSTGVHSVADPNTFDTPQWAISSNLPDARSGMAAYVPNDRMFGNCNDDDDDVTGVLFLQSPSIVIPANVTELRLAFEHWFAIEEWFDGGNVKIQVNDSAWKLVPISAFLFNGYNDTLSTSVMTPLAGEDVFTGTDEGSVSGSWGQSQIDLNGLAVAGDTVKVRFEMGQDNCGGVQGWYVDNVDLYQCVVSSTPASTPTGTSTSTSNNTPIPPDTPTSVLTPTGTPTSTSVPTGTSTGTPTNTPIPTGTPTAIPLPTATQMATRTATATATHTATATATHTATATALSATAQTTPTTSATTTIRSLFAEQKRSGTEQIDNTISWFFENDSNTVGFNLYRSTVPDSDSGTKVFDESIPVKDSQLGTAYYEVEDVQLPVESTYYYWVEQILRDGQTQLSAPVSVVIEIESDIYLPLITIP